jgi:hypothetical protein
MQGYAYIQCTMNSGVTHKAAAQNVISNAGGWTYSGSSCPSCYYTVSGYDSFVGVPGVVYTWNWDGEAICSIRDDFFDDGGSRSIPGCLVPSTETTAEAGTGYTTNTIFNQTIGDSADDTFNGSTVTEGDIPTAQDTCWRTWSIGPRVTGIPPNPPWTVAGGQVLGQRNHWGFDYVGWSTTAIDYYRVQDPAHGVAIPCGFTAYQSMTISCPSGLTAPYTPSFGNKLTATIEQTDVVNCRYDMSNFACQTINY